jgi:hypothetical protein
MLGRVKQWLGIEGVKLELEIPEVVDESDGQVTGIIKLQTMNSQVVNRIKLVFIERYARGRGKEKLVDEYELGFTVIDREIAIPANEITEVPFTLPFSIVKSEMDEMEDKNLLYAGLAKAAKMFSRVKSEFRIEAEAKVKGTALNPFDKKSIQVQG